MVLQTEKYSVAWFKLAEFITRGEKERALGIYKLLAHSLQDEALAIQLRGDILLSFNDERAVTAYQLAAEHYQKQKKYIQSVAIYEHIIVLYPHDTVTMFKLLMLYIKIGYSFKVEQIADKLIQCLVDEKALSHIGLYTTTNQLSDREKVAVRKAVVYAYSKKAQTLEPFSYHLIEQTIKSLHMLIGGNNEQKHETVMEFILQLQPHNSCLYDYALNCLDKIVELTDSKNR